MKLKSYLNKEYFLPNSAKTRFSLSLAFGFIVFLILVVFSPFGLHNINSIEEKTSITLGYGGIAFLVWYFGLELLKLSNSNKGKLWQILLFLMFIQVLAGLLSMLFNNIVFNNPSYFNFFLRFQLISFLTGIIPTFYLLLFMETNYYQNIIKRKNSIARVKEKWVVLRDFNPEKSLKIAPENILYIQSQGNYIKVVWRLDDKLTKMNMLRNTLQSAINTLKDNEEIIQCHRSYLINLRFVEKVKGSSLSKKCLLQHTDTPIPISRPRVKIVLDKLAEKNV